MTTPTSSDMARIYERFLEEGPKTWADGSPVAPNHSVLAFGLFVWSTCARQPDGGGGVFLRGVEDPVDALTGADGTRQLSQRVNRSRIGQRYSARGGPLARDDWWDEIVIELPNPSGLAWGYNATKDTWAAAGQGEDGVFLVSFPASYTAVLNGLRSIS